VSLAFAEDFKTINGKEYKDATINRVEADGIVLRTKTGISKVYFVELPKDVQERFHPSPAKTAPTPAKTVPSPAKTVAAQSERMPIKVFVRVLIVGAVIIITGVVVVGIVRGRDWGQSTNEQE
jgi:hypothetical protein